MNILQQAADALQGGTFSRNERDELALKLARLNVRDGFTLTHCLQIAAERFDHDAATFEAIAAAPIVEAEEGAAPLFHPRAAAQLAEQFRRQAADARKLVDVLEDDDEELEAAA